MRSGRRVSAQELIHLTVPSLNGIIFLGRLIGGEAYTLASLAFGAALENDLLGGTNNR